VSPEGISRTIELYYRDSDLAELGLANVGYSTRGAGLVYGIPFTEFDRVFLGLRYEGTTIDLTPYSPPRYIEYVDDFGEKSDALALTAGWSSDSRDSLLFPTRGRVQSAFAEVALPVLDLEYYRLTYRFQQFWPVTSLVTLAFSTELGYGDGYGNRPYPFFKNFYVGGIGSVRGFEAASLGPRDIFGDPLGGTRRFNASFEALMPIPGADKSLRAAAFLDMGQVWGPGCNGIYVIPADVDPNANPASFCTGPFYGDRASVDLGLLRYSVGIGIAWLSPLGPLRLSYAYPLNAEDWDRTQRFQFQIGSGF